MNLYLTVLLLFLTVPNTWSASNSKGPDSPVVVGVLKSVNGKHIEVQTKDFLRKLEITDKTKVVFVSFLNEAKKMKPGYGVKAKQSGGKLKSIHFTLPLKDSSKDILESTKMTLKQLFEKADLDKSGEVSYVEFSNKVFRSDKHGPDTFVKIDKDKSGAFNLKEFEQKMSGVNWWRLSRKTSSEWFKEADKNSDGHITLDEFNYIAQSGAHYKEHFKKADKDKSQNLSAEEVAAYVKNQQNK